MPAGQTCWLAAPAARRVPGVSWRIRDLILQRPVLEHYGVCAESQVAA
jgi:hypothetical protein